MVKRKTEYTTDTVANLRVSRKMKDEIDNLADAEGISSAEWMRRVIQRELDRVNGVEKDDAPITRKELMSILSGFGITQTNSGNNVNQNINIK